MNRLRGAFLPIHLYAVVVLLNYAAQVLYAAHLYGAQFSRPGALLLGLTLAWFVLSYVLTVGRRPAGYWMLLAYALAQFVFYFHGQVLLAFVGYGLPYQLTHARDLLVWTVFVIGDVNFGAATLVLGYLVRRRRILVS